jgi:hypothetical protein
MKGWWFTLVMGLAVAVPGYSQTVQRFPASQVQEIATRYAGSERNWPIVASVASYFPEENWYELSVAAQAELARFLANYNAVSAQRIDFNRQIRDGAKVFAAEEMQRADTLSAWYQRHIQTGSLSNAIGTGESLIQAMRATSDAVAKNRKVDVEARLAEKSGIVDRRDGLLGAWDTADLGNLFRQSDGIRTAAKSLAKLNFVDGSDVIVNENSVAVIRNSRIDRLTNETDVEITVSSGGLLARLSTNAVERSTYQVNVESATTTLKSRNFYAERTEDRRVILSNYNGEATVTAESSSVTLEENQGTIVVRGREPLPPINLLPAPRLSWSGTDSVIYQEQITLTWNAITGSARYEVDLSPTPFFDKTITQYSTETPRLSLADLPEGTSYIRVRAYDRQELRGVDSPTYRVLRNLDLIPPPIFLRNTGRLNVYSPTNQLTLIGTTEPGSVLTVNGSRADVDSKGEFETIIQLTEPRTPLEIVATDRSGNRTVEKRTAVWITETKLFELNWSVPVNGSRVGRSETITISGVAYEPLDVVVTVAGRTIIVPCGTNGDWAVDVNPADTETIRIAFRFKRDQIPVAERTYTVE